MAEKINFEDVGLYALQIRLAKVKKERDEYRELFVQMMKNQILRED
jgi:hypothetical protein